MKKILVVEDDPFTADLYCSKLESAGYAVDCAETGREAIRRITRKPPDLVLVDLMVGEVNGVDVIRQVRKKKTTRNLPVVVLTNAFMSDMLTQAWNVGATDCLNKANCSPVRLVEAVRKTFLLKARKGSLQSTDLAPAKPLGPAENQSNDDPEFHLWLRADLLSKIQSRMRDLSSAVHDWASHERNTTGDAYHALRTAVHSLAATSGLAGCHHASKLLHALEALLNEIRVEPRKLTPSVFRTVRQSIDILSNVLRPDPDSLIAVPKPPLILIVDDEPVARELLFAGIEEAQMSAISFNDPNLALQLCEQNAFDIVLLDIDMPGMNGFELCERIHNTAMNMQTPIVFVSAQDDPATRERFQESGAADFIGKPIMLNELATKVLLHLARSDRISAN